MTILLMRRHSFIIKLAVFTVIFLSIIQVVASNMLSTSGIGLGKIEDETLFYKRENASLSEELFLSSSLATLTSRAESLGFVGEKSDLVLKALPLAQR